MIKYITFVYVVGNVNMTTTSEYCEIKDLQSPYVKKIDDSTDNNPPYIPVDTCNIAPADVSDTRKALLECIKMQQNWRKI